MLNFLVRSWLIDVGAQFIFRSPTLHDRCPVHVSRKKVARNVRALLSVTLRLVDLVLGSSPRAIDGHQFARARFPLFIPVAFPANLSAL